MVATWTPCSEREWDVTAGTALVRAACGRAFFPDGSDVTFNRRSPKFDGFVALGPNVDPYFFHDWPDAT